MWQAGLAARQEGSGCLQRAVVLAQAVRSGRQPAAVGAWEELHFGRGWIGESTCGLKN